jgi:hypothetical protein
MSSRSSIVNNNRGCYRSFTRNRLTLFMMGRGLGMHFPHGTGLHRRQCTWSARRSERSYVPRLSRSGIVSKPDFGTPRCLARPPPRHAS